MTAIRVLLYYIILFFGVASGDALVIFSTSAAVRTFSGGFISFVILEILVVL